MSEKPSYEELEKKLIQLENKLRCTGDTAERRQAEKQLKESEMKYRLLADNATDIIWILNLSTMTFDYVSPSVERNTGFTPAEAQALTMERTLSPQSLEHVAVVLNEELSNEKKVGIDKNRTRTIEVEQLVKGGGYSWSEITVSFIRDKNGNPIAITGVTRDISARKKVELEKAEKMKQLQQAITDLKLAERALNEAHDKLERKVEARTAELSKANKQLRVEITERKMAERTLKEKKINLEETNTALKVLLKKRDTDKTELEENLLLNVKELLEPYLGKLKKSSLNDMQMTIVNILESNIKDIVSSFTRKLSSKLYNLTPAELQVANFVKHGKSTKEIASYLHLSPKTVKNHRGNIRKKLDLTNKRINLRSYLFSLE